MILTRTLTLIAFSLALLLSSAPLSLAQDAEPFDPYESYQNSQAKDEALSELPAPIDLEQITEPKEDIGLAPAPREDMSDQDVIDWMDDVEAASRAQAEADNATKAAETAGVTETETEFETETETEVEVTLQAQPETEATPEPMLEPAALQNSSEKPRKATTISALETNRPDIAPFYLTAEQYLGHRGDAPSAQLHLTYRVEREQISGNTAAPQSVTLIIGPDFAAMTQSGDGTQAAAQKIYDFKLGRLITLTPEGDALRMMNSSLYALVHRNVTTIRKVTKSGAQDKVQAGNMSLDAFWMESALSFAMNDRLSDLVTQEDPSSAKVAFKDETIFALTFSDTPYPDRAHSDAFMAFAHHGLPLHPSVLRQFFGAQHPPQSLNMVMKGPNFPQGQTQIWTLTEAALIDAPFPLPLDAISVTQSQPIDPVAFVISEAATGRALGGRPSRSALSGAVQTAINDSDPRAAWLSAQRYLALFGDCKADAGKSGQTVCAAIEDIEARSDLPDDLRVMIKAFKDAKVKGQRVAVVKALRPYADKPDAPAIVLKTLGLARAKIRSGAAKAAMIDQIDGEALLIQALARDPYDPDVYLGLAQIHAANGRYEAAWDMHDALRASLAPTSARSSVIDGVEDKLRSGAPGYFIP